ncbi:hypothetical protein RFL88_09405, partial [Streptococcus suis]
MFYTPNLTSMTDANRVRFISNLKLSPRQFELCGGREDELFFLPFVKSIKALSKKIKHNSSYFEAATLFLSL